MAIYFPPLFCGKGTLLKVKKDFVVEFNDEEVFSIGDKCIVDEIIGYGYNIRRVDSSKVFRIMNSSMDQFFEIVEKVEPENQLKNSYYISKEKRIITLTKDFELKDLIKISNGREFIHFIDVENGRKFHDLFLNDGRERILRLSDSEFNEYFSA